MSPHHPTIRWRGTDLYCSRWFSNGLGPDCGKLMDLDRSGALNILAGSPTTQMPWWTCCRFFRKPPAIHDLRAVRQPIWRAMPARLRCLRLGVARNRRSDGTFGALGLDIILQIVNCNSVSHDPSGISKAWRKDRSAACQSVSVYPCARQGAALFTAPSAKNDVCPRFRGHRSRHPLGWLGNSWPTTAVEILGLGCSPIRSSAAGLWSHAGVSAGLCGRGLALGGSARSSGAALGWFRLFARLNARGDVLSRPFLV